MPMTANRPGSGPSAAACSAVAMSSTLSTRVSARFESWAVVDVSVSRFSMPKRSMAATRSVSRRW